MPAANSEAVRLCDIPVLGVREFREAVLTAIRSHSEVLGPARIAALHGRPTETGRVALLAVLAHGQTGSLSFLSTEVDGAYEALTPECTQAHWFEREIAELWSVRPEGHPWLKPIRFQAAAGNPARGAKEPVICGVMEFFQVEGHEVHEVAVGPVHAGIIEPGHFRFQCHGEQVLHLEISLGYQHRGVERSLVGGPDKRAIHSMETLAGDTSIAHATAYCQAVESLAGCRVPARAQAIRGIALELERLANHTGDLGALANDVGYLPTASYCGRIRGDFLNLTALLCGSRFGRGLVRPGGVAFDADPPLVAEILDRLERGLRDVTAAANLLWDTSSVRARFEDVGILTRKQCEELGIVGPAARASGLARDSRVEFPAGIFRVAQVHISTWEKGDVFARAYVRWLEIERSAAFVRELLATLPEGPTRVPLSALRPNLCVASLAEGWRGEICHIAITDGRGKFSTYKVVDPSFHNWIGLSMAMRGQQISDFPLCNKSFNLSYCGHDL
ncbi:MAG: NADH-quinone oxidoreductase subunit C [Planctomycetes bacterium]|nr:NADH-quinone oxidoreductase subunit C [Planctomycetota bacterium]